MLEAKPIMIFHCRRHLFPITSAKSANPSLLHLSMSRINLYPKFHYVNSGRKTTSLVILQKDTKSLGISSLPKESISTLHQL
jgi:hypothetical protein